MTPDPDPATPLAPLTFIPVFKDYPWGGRNLERYGRTLPPGIVAESWDIAAHPHGSSLVREGPLQGMSLPDVTHLWGERLLGERNHDAVEQGRFPLLIKLLDANQWLSVQVHPDDAYAQMHDNDLGKTEMWVVLEAAPGAELIYGFTQPQSRAACAQAIHDGRSADLLYHMPVTAGDTIFVPPGAIHALGPRIVVAEIQQNSDSTYRVFDWGRDRPLHIEKALDVLNYSLVAARPIVPRPLLIDDTLSVDLLVECEYFQVERLSVPPDGAFFGLAEGETFEIFGVLAGRATVEWAGDPVTLAAVDWVLIPADLGDFQVVAQEPSIILRIFVPEPAE